jgi:hypothetical protein
MQIGKFLPFIFGLGLIMSFSQAGFSRTKEQFPKHSENSENKMMSKSKDAKKRPKFYKVLDKILPKRGLDEKNICNETDAVQLRILNEYGSVFVVAEGVVPPPTCMFTSPDEVNAFQQRIFKAGAEIAGTYFELQTIAMQQLLKAREAALEKGLDITPRGGSEAARRSFEDTFRLWKSRFEPASDYWLKEGRLTAEQVEKLKSLPIREQVREVLELEKQGIYFNTRFNDSILYSVAAPGTSQHLSMLALDVKEFQDAKVREILAEYGWFRTVQNDTPHFTFLGHKEKNLKKMGLKKIETKDGEFWIPDTKR